MLNRSEAGASPRAFAVPHRFVADRRKSLRTSCYVPLLVYGHTPSGEPFHENTNSMQTSSGGALVRLEAAVARGQRLLLVNKMTQQEMVCQVVRISHPAKRKHIGIAFLRSSPDFWRTEH